MSMLDCIRKEKTVSLSNYIEIVKPKYTVIEVVSHKSIRNYNSSNLAKGIADTYMSLNRRIYMEGKKLIVKTNFKISYCIDIRVDSVRFFFIVPSLFLDSMLEKINEIWSKCTVNVLDEKIEPFSDNALYYELGYKRDDALSLDIDKKCNEPLTTILTVKDNLRDDDRVMLFYNFLPCSQEYWVSRYCNSIDKYKSNKSLDKPHLTFDYIVKNGILCIFGILNSLFEVIGDMIGGSSSEGSRKKESGNIYNAIWGILEKQQQLSRATQSKKKATILNGQVAVISDSNDKGRKVSNALSVCQAFRTLDEDNELRYSRVRKSFSFYDASISKSVNTFSSDECSNFIQIPGREILKKYNIKYTESEEGVIPAECRRGYFSLGRGSYRGVGIDTYLPDEYNVGSFPLVVDGPQGGGKSTFMANVLCFARKRKEGGVLIDYIKENELSDIVIEALGGKDVIVLDYSKVEDMQGFAFNEVDNIECLTPFNFLKVVGKQLDKFIELINIFNDSTQNLQSRMRRYFIAAGNVVFSSGSRSLRSVVECLSDCDKRADYIAKVPEEYRVLLADKIEALRDLDKYSSPKNGEPPSVIGNADNKVDAILDRISLLKEDIGLEYMFDKGDEGNIDFAKELEKGKIIIVKMLQDEWSSRAKDIITTFLVSKIWLATEIRGRWSKKPRRCHICIDEIFQCPTSVDMLIRQNVLPQTRKFGCKFIFTVQGLHQLKKLLITILDAGGSFMLLRGVKEEDYNLLRSKIEGFEYDDIRSMGSSCKFPSFNLINCGNKYASFITELPPPVWEV